MFPLASIQLWTPELMGVWDISSVSTLALGSENYLFSSFLAEVYL